MPAKAKAPLDEIKDAVSLPVSLWALPPGLCNSSFLRVGSSQHAFAVESHLCGVYVTRT